MSHSAHRMGTPENLKNDFVIYARTSRYVNREGCGPKLRRILELILSEKPVNFGSSHAGKSYAAGLDPAAYAESLDKAYGVAASFSDPERLKRLLQKLVQADIGISIVVSGLIDEIRQMGREVGFRPHTALLSLGIHGKKAAALEPRVLEITTMCGHGLVARSLARQVMHQVENGEISPREGARILAQPCPCGIFNLDRCTALFEEYLAGKAAP